MTGKIEFTIAAVKATEEIGSFLNPKIQFVYFKDEEATHSVDSLDHFLSDIQKGRKGLNDSVEEIKSYSARKAKKTLIELYTLEDVITGLVEVAKSIPPESPKEKKLLAEFIAFGNDFLGIIGLLEVMCLTPKAKKRILLNDGKASRESKEVNLDLL